MKKSVAFLFSALAAILVCTFLTQAKSIQSISKTKNIYPIPGMLCANPVAEYEGKEDEDLADVMVPIPMKDRVQNYTGIQCVWVSIEALGRYAEEPKLIGLNKDPECKSYSNPSSAACKLKQLGVKFEQTTSKSDRSLIIKSVVKERRGCLFAVPGHAMVLVHYDEKKGIVKYFNNSDSTLKIRIWTMEEFNKRWDGWILVIYADNDIIPLKYSQPATQIPIMDRNNQQGEYPKNYILFPKRQAAFPAITVLFWDCNFFIDRGLFRITIVRESSRRFQRRWLSIIANIRRNYSERLISFSQPM